MHRAEGYAAERAMNEFSVISNAADEGEGRAPGTSHISVNNPRASEFRSGYSVERIHGHRNSNIPRKDERNKHWKTKHRRGEIVAKRGSISVAYFLSYNMLFGKEMFRIVGNALQYEDRGTDPEVTSSSSSLQPDFDMNTETLWDFKTAESRDDEGFEKVWHRFATWTDQDVQLAANEVRCLLQNWNALKSDKGGSSAFKVSISLLTHSLKNGVHRQWSAGRGRELGESHKESHVLMQQNDAMSGRQPREIDKVEHKLSDDRLNPIYRFATGRFNGT
ncbi:hypothetical protein B0H13DRAFT_1918847 [Mycena leptocephala]|nr:hypothetical protein B0H13DRAFT_1918847 [Mycena leptocephala]